VYQNLITVRRHIIARNQRMMQPYNIADKDALLTIQRISTASSISQIPIILSASATNIDANIGHEELDKDKIIRSAVENT
jgi:hypothetical protein